MKISVVVTVLNEEGSIGRLLDSLLSQTIVPDEIVIVDGGSSDNTTEIIKTYKAKHSIIHFIVEPGSIAHGRNVAITNAKHTVIAQTDGGCIAEKDWLEKITKPFDDEKVELVAGFYKMVAHTPFQKAAAPFFGVLPKDFDPRNFLPSARSVAMRKSLWEKIGGYSESLERAGEDTLFNYQVVKNGIPIYREKDAIVHWEVPRSYWAATKKFFIYAWGDAQAGIWWHPAQEMATHNIKITKIFIRYGVAVFFFLLSLFSPLAWLIFVSGSIFYVFLSGWKMRYSVTNTVAKFWVPLIQITSDCAVMAGFLVGKMRKR